MSAPKTKVAIIFYSELGGVADDVAEGVNSVEGVEGVLLQVAETLSPDILEKMHAPPKPWPEIPVIQPNELAEYDGFLFGIPTRFGMMAAQMKSLFDATGQLWVKGSLVGKPAGVFVSVGTQGGGIETTALTTVTQLTHHGMIFVPCGYSFGERMFDLSEMHAGTPYGPATYAGAKGERQPSQFELDYCRHQGEYFAKVAKKISGK
ncbi:hypothetical protein N2152v2_005663 [Parachlorella kessleri]